MPWWVILSIPEVTSAQIQLSEGAILLWVRHWLDSCHQSLVFWGEPVSGKWKGQTQFWATQLIMIDQYAPFYVQEMVVDVPTYKSLQKTSVTSLFSQQRRVFRCLVYVVVFLWSLHCGCRKENYMQNRIVIAQPQIHQISKCNSFNAESIIQFERVILRNGNWLDVVNGLPGPVYVINKFGKRWPIIARCRRSVLRRWFSAVLKLEVWV